MKQILNEGKLSQVEIVAIEPFVSSNEKIVGFSKLFLADGTQTVLSPEELRKSVTEVHEPEAPAVETVPAPQPEEPAVEPANEAKEEAKEEKQAVRTGTKRSKNK